LRWPNPGGEFIFEDTNLEYVFLGRTRALIEQLAIMEKDAEIEELRAVHNRQMQDNKGLDSLAEALAQYADKKAATSFRSAASQQGMKDPTKCVAAWVELPRNLLQALVLAPYQVSVTMCPWRARVLRAVETHLKFATQGALDVNDILDAQHDLDMLRIACAVHTQAEFDALELEARAGKFRADSGPDFVDQLLAQWAKKKSSRPFARGGGGGGGGGSGNFGGGAHRGRGGSSFQCYNCGGRGHSAAECPSRKKFNTKQYLREDGRYCKEADAALFHVEHAVEDARSCTGRRGQMESCSSSHSTGTGYHAAQGADTADAPTLRMFLRGIRRTQDHTSHQALPMTRSALMQIIRDQPPEIHAPIFWAWSTCSRMSDVRSLTKKNLVNYSKEYILVIFERTKTNWQAARRLDHLALVPKKHIPLSVLRYTGGSGKGDPLTTSTHRIAEALKRVKTSKTYVAEFRKLIPLAAKHTGLWASKIPASTIAYAPVLGHVAEAVGLGKIGKALWL
jgi:hypothetical protein